MLGISAMANPAPDRPLRLLGTGILIIYCSLLYVNLSVLRCDFIICVLDAIKTGTMVPGVENT